MRGHESASVGLRGSRLRVLPLAVALLLAAALALLSGCGDLPLVDALQGDSPGELRFSPSTALIPLNTDFMFSVMGGVGEYTLTTAETLTPVDEDTWIFKGKTSIATNPQDFSILATDRLGNTAAAVVTVYSLAALSLDVQNVTLLEGDSWTFNVIGGQDPYDWSVNGESQGSGSSYLFGAVSAGPYTVSVTDYIGVTRAATVNVIAAPPDGSDLQLLPDSATVLPGGTVVFTAMGGSGNYTFSVVTTTGATIAAELDGNPAIYTAGTKGTDTVSVVDNVYSALPAASSTVTVVASPLQALSLSPASPSVSAVNDTIEFTAANGTAPYSFSTDHPIWGSIEAVEGVVDRAVYTQHAERNVMVRVTDANGTSVSTMVFWQL